MKDFDPCAQRTRRGTWAAYMLGGLTLLGCAKLQQAGQACGLSCPAKGIAEGNAAISGIQSVDAFFGAVVKFKSAADLLANNVAEAKARLALSVGLPTTATDAELKAALQAKIDANAQGGVKLRYKKPECRASIDATIDATARCDAEFDPGKAEVKCEGSCTAEAGAEVKCEGDAQLVCHGTAPQLKCSGSCTGSCQLDVAGKCDGTCNGSCAGGTGGDRSVSGQCDGKCKGECQMKAGGECSGKCEGECEYTPGEAGCSADAKVECRAEANASVDCKGSCDGSVVPPKAKAECEAAAQAEASADVECTPPEVEVTYKFKAGLKANQKAEFAAWLNGFKTQMAVLAVEAEGRGRVLLASAGSLASAAEGAVKGSISELKTKAAGDLRITVGAGCALGQLEAAGKLIAGAQASVTASTQSVAEVMSVAKSS
jgi:hypothetical protein